MNREKKALLLLWTYIVILLTPKTKSHSNITYNENYIYGKTPYASYNTKDIYIVNGKKIKNINLSNENIYIIDDRYNKDPDMSICNSYQFKNIDEINAILQMLIEYESKYPTDWDRTYKSMKNEWIIHNICYFLNIQTSRTEQVDFNNDDEEIYLNYLKILKEILNTNNSKKTLIKKN